jgi:glycosyltransferase involved in cell wall biosynthesis
MLKIMLYPIFENEDTLRDVLYRTVWYLKPFEKYIDEITLYVKFNTNIEQLCSVEHKYLDSNIPKYVKTFSKLKVIYCSSENQLNFNSQDYIFVFKEKTRNNLIKLKNEKNYKFEIVRIDHEEVQYADSFFLRFAEKINGLHEQFRQISHQKINEFLPALKSDKIYLFGTGPNFSYTTNINFSDGLVIACNSMVVNSDIINKIQPKLFVIADPIFHAGPSSYAEEFRKSLLEVLGKMKNPIIVPLRDYHIYLTYFDQKIISRIIPIAFENLGESEGSQNLDIIKNNFVTTTSNILTLFQLPLASTLGKNIFISGCDGRPLSHNQYFWSHSKSVQINDKMNDIKIAHPSFFNISYDDYYLKHIETLEKWCSNIEANGQNIYNLTPSYIPALQKRMVDNIIGKQLEDKEFDLSVVIPLYNAETYIRKAIDSILKTCTFEVEIIIVDDFSEDSSLSLAKEYEEKYDNVFVFQNFYTKGVSGARNTGIKLSRGNALCFLDADDFVYPDSLNKRLQRLNESANNLIVHGKLKFVDEHDTFLGVEVGTGRTITFNDCIGNPASFNTFMFKREIIQYLWFDEKLTNGEDWLAISKVLRRGYKSIYVEEGYAAYRIHPNSTVIKDYNAHEKLVLPVIDWLYKEVSTDEAVKSYCVPLKTLSKEEVVNLRNLGKLITNIFSSNNNDLKYLLTNSLKDYIKNETIDFRLRLRVPFVRSFIKHIDESKKLPLAELDIIVNNLKLLDDFVPNSKLSKDIKSFFNIKNEKILNSDMPLKKANFLYREKKFLAAMAIYEKLILQDKFYSFLSYNVELCKKKEGIKI